ncbi:uncharacterized protein LOC129347620 [Amphiprion ocellaris]|uniref:uncharacterized protein LOC129347620 n=1 Tax=Amphiprion ocellaris TaxID=80972 RepID=UPI0024110168|nr:uncharacterized protein LOC129347620 [Amphiprion ocellaris]
MAEDVLGKSVKELKKERTTAKSSFTRQANFISRGASSMLQVELKEEFTKLSDCFRKMLNANDDYRIGLEADIKTENEEADLDEQQEADIDRSVKEGETKLAEIRDIVQTNLWSRYGKSELDVAILEAEKAADRAAGVTVESSNLEGYGVHLILLDKRVKEAISAMSTWERWIPAELKDELDGRVKDVRASYYSLELRKADFATARMRDEKLTGVKLPPQLATPTPMVRIQPITLPIFNGNKREYHRWRKDWESLQKQGEPSGSIEVKKIQLLESVDDKISKDLRLSTYTTANDMFRVLENRYGNKLTITVEILEELEKMPHVKGNQPRKVIDLIQSVEKALADLTELGNSGAIKNPLVVKSIESKLPDFIKRDWLMFMVEPRNNVTSDNHFDMLLKFLKSQEEILERLEQLRTVEKTEKTDRFDKKYERKIASTKTTKKEKLDEVCGVCGDGGHNNKIFFCRKFKRLKLPEKKAVLRKLGACRKCLGCHDEDGYCRDTFLCRNKDCKRGGDAPDHHFFLCPKGEVKRGEEERSGKYSKGESTLTEEQKQILSELTPEMADRCRKAFTNTNKTTGTFDASGQSDLLQRNGLAELPVIMMLMQVTANAGQKIGTLIDLASDTNYITHKAAERLRLRNEKITLVVHGVGGMTMKVNTQRYLLKVRVKTPKGTERAHEMVCYGLDEIARVHQVIEPEQLKKFFPEVKLEELERPEEVELLISHREGRLAPQRVKVIGDLVLWEGPLGKTVGGAHPDLFEEVEVAAYESKTHFARSMRTAAVKYQELRIHSTDIAQLQQEDMAQTKFTASSNRNFLEWWHWDSIGAACEPRCGGCRCGNCPPGGKEMTLAEEMELDVIKRGLTYRKGDAHTPSPHWDAKYPWTVDPASLPNNKGAVQACFLRMEKQLSREPDWKVAYATQIHEMVERGAAIQLTNEVMDQWNGPVWYVSHLVAPNPHSVTTPVRIVWNSSQKYKGVSMNDLLLKGPDVLNPIRAVLLRFREGMHAALGDIKKMYNSVWLEDREMHLHRFLWRASPDEEISEYAITRVNIGDRPAGCIAQVAMRETASLPNFVHLEVERRVIEEDSYVDDLLTSHNDLNKLNKITANVEEILKAGGFFLKPWVRSGQSGRQGIETEALTKKQDRTFILPNQMRDEDNKALGIGYQIDEDKLYMLTSVNFSKRKKKMRIGKNLLKEEVRTETPNPLTRRALLSQVAGLYDPIGLVTPAKQKGAILVRKAFQEGRGGKLTQETWDQPLSNSLREEAIQLFEEYVQLGQVKFHRSLTPADWKGKPWGITFSDGSEKTYGAVMYIRWETSQGTEVRLVESKAKLTPLDQKGEAVKAEICGAVFAARIRKYVEKHARMKIERWFHLLDSQTVLGAIQRDSYGYKTFFANRVGEIQKAGPVQDWWWVRGEMNIADLITRGGTPEDLKEDSIWQNGPEFLKWPVEEWPIKSAGEVAAHARESVNKLQRKAFSSALTRAQARSRQQKEDLQTTQSQKSEAQEEKPVVKPTLLLRRKPTGWVKDTVEVRRFSSLSKLVRVVAWVCLAAKQWLKRKCRAPKQSKWEETSPKQAVLTVSELEDALNDIFLAAQEGAVFPDTTLSRLAVYKDVNSGLLVCGGRIQMFNEDKTAVPVLPFEAWVSTLLAQESHKANHEGVAGTLLRMRKKAWVIKGRRLAKKTVDSCVVCRKHKAKQCQQIMADLPLERTGPAAPFEFTTMDLFGPYEVKDEVKKRTRLRVWGIVFCCMASRAIHTEVVSDMSSEGFLLAYQRFTSLRGHPRKLWSDPGTNFVGAKPALEQLHKFLDRLNKYELEDTAAKHGTEWSWKIHPADSPHRNGAAEAAVKVVKRALSNLGGDGVFSWGEFQTFLFMAANLANERPIDARTQSREDCIEYITPNSLLLGRASPKGDPGDFQFEGYPYKRLQSIQAEVNKFWRKWSQLAGPNLFIRNKWHTENRNVAVGDVVWLADQNALRGQYKLARVVSVNADSKGIVRDVLVKTFPSYPVPITKPNDKKGPTKEKSARTKRLQTKIPATILHRDVRRLVILLPTEEQ